VQPSSAPSSNGMDVGVDTRALSWLPSGSHTPSRVIRNDFNKLTLIDVYVV
jgi:hypothetical protein